MKQVVIVIHGGVTWGGLMDYPSANDPDVIRAQEPRFNRGQPLRLADTIVIDERHNLVRGAFEHQVPRTWNIRPLQKLTSKRQTVTKFF